MATTEKTKDRGAQLSSEEKKKISMLVHEANVTHRVNEKASFILRVVGEALEVEVGQYQWSGWEDETEEVPKKFSVPIKEQVLTWSANSEVNSTKGLHLLYKSGYDSDTRSYCGIPVTVYIPEETKQKHTVGDVHTVNSPLLSITYDNNTVYQEIVGVSAPCTVTNRSEERMVVRNADNRTNKILIYKRGNWIKELGAVYSGLKEAYENGDVNVLEKEKHRNSEKGREELKAREAEIEKVKVLERNENARVRDSFDL